MSAKKFTVSFGTKTVSFDKFANDDVPGGYLAQASLDFSQIGTAYSSGPARKQRKIWAISAYVTADEWSDLTDVYEEWDVERAKGRNIAEVTVVNELIGESQTSKGFFTEPPSLTKVAPSNNFIFLASFVITET
jgi:hypothetical protein